jgi:hypothetical protein
MTVPAPPPGPPGPDDRPRLSSRERSILARIESELAAADPTLAQELATRRPPLLRGRAGRTARWFLVLAVILTVLSVSTLLPAASWWPVLPLLTVFTVGPWLVLCARPPRGD